MSHHVLVLNCGSSSIKYQLIDTDTEVALASGLVEKIGEAEGTITHKSDGQTHSATGVISDHAVGLQLMRQMFTESGHDLADAGIVAVGHRVVHGGSKFSHPTLIDDQVVQDITELSVLAPLHNPGAVVGIQRARLAFPDVPHVAIFDTAFFADLPLEVATYAIDRKVASNLQIRRYGFHGTSHSYVSRQVAKLLGRPYSELNQIVLHVGSGASVSAIRGGHAVETSMGLTPLEGLVMGTRCGDLDPGVVFHLNRVGGMSIDEIDVLLNRKSGMIGLAGVNDFRDLHRLIEAGDANAKLALQVWVHRLRKYIGAYYAVLGTVDAITFTAGVGENDAKIRELVMANLISMGIAIDPARNEAPSREARVISPAGAPVTILVVPTNEELAIAQGTLETIEAA